MIDRYDPLETPRSAREGGSTLKRRGAPSACGGLSPPGAGPSPNAKVHAVMHAIIENQIALGDEIPVQRTAQRLMDEGLDRHDTIHAIGSVLVGHMFDLTRQPATDDDPNQPLLCRAGAYYGRALAEVRLSGRTR